MTIRKRVGVLISGRGSNLASLIEATRDPGYPAEIVLVLSNKADAYGLVRAKEANIPTRVVSHKSFPSREEFDAVITGALKEARVDLVCNAGFMRLHSAAFVREWSGRQLNIHPSLLPAFRGLHPQARALEAGVRVVRRDRPLRQRRDGCRPDHRPGGGASRSGRHRGYACGPHPCDGA